MEISVNFKITLICSVVLCCPHPRPLVSQEAIVHNADSSFQERRAQFDSLATDEAEQPALRFDFKWAEQFHAMVSSIQKNDDTTFTRTASALENEKSADTLAQAYGRDLLLWFLRKYVNSREVALSDLDKKWHQESEFNWDWDTLFAMNDILDRLYSENDLQKASLKQSIQNELARKFASLEEALGQSIVSKSELSRRAFRYVRRLMDEEVAVQECDRLLLILKDDFGLNSILIERLSALHKGMPDQWREKYHRALLASRTLLRKAPTLRQQFPMATPKILTELSRLQTDSKTKILELTAVLEACAEADHFLSLDEKLSSVDNALNQNTLKELRASALLDGFRICKTITKKNVDPNRSIDERPFAPSAVTIALQQLAEIYRDRSPKKYLNAQLSLAGVLFDLMSERPTVDSDIVRAKASEVEFLGIIDDSIKLLGSSAGNVGRYQKYMDTCQDFELSWAERCMKQASTVRIQGMDTRVAQYSAQRSCNNEELLERLTRLQQTIRSERKTRVITAIGYLHLMNGDYQKAINALEGIEQNHRFAATVIRCLAHKDSGNFEASRVSLDAIVLDEDPQLRITQGLIRLSLESELLIAEGKSSAATVGELEEKLEQRRKAGDSERKPSIENMLQLNNEHHQALNSISSLGTETPIATQRVDIENERQKAIAIWEEHLAFSGENQKFIRARAAYSLAVVHLTMGSDELVAQKNAVLRSIAAYKEELNTYHNSERRSRADFDALQSTLVEIRMSERFIHELENQQVNDGPTRKYCLDALTKLHELREQTGDWKYPSLAYNILCLVLRVHLLSPSNDEFVKAIFEKGWTLESVSQEACGIALMQRTKVSGAGVFGTQRDLLFERYRDAFDLAVELAAGDGSGVLDAKNFHAAFIGAETNNQTIVDLFRKTRSSELESDPLRGRKFISFFVSTRATHVFWRIRDGDIHYHRANISRPDVARAVTNYVSSYLSQPLPTERSTSAYEQARDLQKELFCETLTDDMHWAEESGQCVYVIPHGPLFQLPLDTLPVGGTAAAGEFLANRCPPLVYLPSLIGVGNSAGIEKTYGAALLTIQPEKEIGTESKFLFDKFEADGALRIGPTGISETSGNQVESSQLAFDQNRLLGELERGYRFVHFGSHGSAALPTEQLAESHASESLGSQQEGSTYLVGAFLELWNADEKLTAADVIERFNPQNDSRLHTELVFLSACESQVTDTSSLKYGGNTIKAMGTAFLVAGAENVIASHWKVNDDSTTQLVSYFMQQVMDKSKPSLTVEEYAKILHKQRKQLAESERFEAPNDWGPFTLSTTLRHEDQR